MNNKICTLGLIVFGACGLNGMKFIDSIAKISTIQDVPSVCVALLNELDKQKEVTFNFKKQLTDKKSDKQEEVTSRYENISPYKVVRIDSGKKSDLFWLFMHMHGQTSKIAKTYPIKMETYSNQSNFGLKLSHGYYVNSNEVKENISSAEPQKEYEHVIIELKKGWRFMEKNSNDAFFQKDVLSEDLEQKTLLINFLLNNLDLKQAYCFKDPKNNNSLVLSIASSHISDATDKLQFDALQEYKK